jgi:hypothetical protein
MDGGITSWRVRPLPVFALTEGSEDVTVWAWRDERIIKLPTNATAAATQLVAAFSADLGQLT